MKAICKDLRPPEEEDEDMGTDGVDLVTGQLDLRAKRAAEAQLDLGLYTSRPERKLLLKQSMPVIWVTLLALRLRMFAWRSGLSKALCKAYQVEHDLRIPLCFYMFTT